MSTSVDIATRPEPAGSELSPRSVTRILIVDDETSLSGVLRDYLELHRFEVTTADDGVGGLHALKTGAFDLILCDLTMPRMSGDLLYQAVQRLYPHLCERFIFMTAYAWSPNLRDFLNQVGATVLMKPFHLNDLLAIIQKRLRELKNASPHSTPPSPTPNA